MVKKDNNIDEIIKEKFEDFQVSPPNHMWRNIKGSVAGGSSLFLIQKFLGTPLGAGVSVVTGLTVAIIGYNVFTGDKGAVSMNEKETTEQSIVIQDEDIIDPLGNQGDNIFTGFMVSKDAGTLSSKEFISPLIKNRNAGNINTGEKGKIKFKELNDAVSDKQSEQEVKEEQSAIIAEVSDKENASSIITASDNIAQDNANNEVEAVTSVTSDQLLSGEIKEIEPGYKNLSNVIKKYDETIDLNSIARIVFGFYPREQRYNKPSYLSTTSAEDSALFAPIPPPVQIKDDYGKRSDLNFGLFYAPEKVYYPERGDQKSNTFEVNAMYHFSDFMVQSGVGLSIVEDICKYDVNYNCFEIVGSFYEVDSLSFDSITGIPTYYTTLQHVYDSVNRDSQTNTVNKYSYLRIPFIFGYQKYFKRFSYYIKGGPVLNILVKNTEPRPYLTAENIAVQSYDRLAPGRIKTYWQLYVGVGLTYDITNRLGILIEPTASYNVSTVYERNYLTGKRPYSIGIRTGLIFNL